MKAFKGEFPELSTWSPLKALTPTKKHAESSKINKKLLFLKNENFMQNEKQLEDLFYEINPDISISKSTFYASGNIKILPKSLSDYFLIYYYNAIYRITKNHITIVKNSLILFLIIRVV